jgi:PUCC protein
VFASPTPEYLILPLMVLGVGQGMFMTPVLNVVLSAIPENHAGAASGVLTTVQRAGYALGVAALEVPFFTTLDSAHIAGSSQSAAYIAAFAAVAVCILVTMISVLVLLALLPSGRGASG